MCEWRITPYWSCPLARLRPPLCCCHCWGLSSSPHRARPACSASLDNCHTPSDITHSLTVSHTHCLTHSLSHCLTVSLYHCLTHSLFHCLTVSLTHSLGNEIVTKPFRNPWKFHDAQTLERSNAQTLKGILSIPPNSVEFCRVSLAALAQLHPV